MTNAEVFIFMKGMFAGSAFVLSIICVDIISHILYGDDDEDDDDEPLP